ncbi:MAG: hypothetical protein GAK34_02368 [Delftia tsuruhatensis]|nr:MAG: hypothetical protein GAK34_02368 [Delftia tsuruhatensis]
MAQDSIARATWCAGMRRASWSTWGGWTTRSRSAACASSWARCRRNCWRWTMCARPWSWPARDRRARGCWPMCLPAAGGPWTGRRCASAWPRYCPTTWCRPPSWCWTSCRRTPTASWTGRPCPRSACQPPARRPRANWRRCWPVSGPRCWAWSGWGAATTSSRWAVIPSSACRSSRACAASAGSCRHGSCSNGKALPSWRVWPSPCRTRPWSMRPRSRGAFPCCPFRRSSSKRTCRSDPTGTRPCCCAARSRCSLRRCARPWPICWPGTTACACAFAPRRRAPGSRPTQARPRPTCRHCCGCARHGMPARSRPCANRRSAAWTSSTGRCCAGCASRWATAAGACCWWPTTWSSMGSPGASCSRTCVRPMPAGCRAWSPPGSTRPPATSAGRRRCRPMPRNAAASWPSGRRWPRCRPSCPVPAPGGPTPWHGSPASSCGWTASAPRP